MTTNYELRTVGAIPAFLALREISGVQPGLNYLYALIGALEDRDWRDVAKNDRDRLLFELKGCSEFEKLFGAKGNP